MEWAVSHLRTLRIATRFFLFNPVHHGRGVGERVGVGAVGGGGGADISGANEMIGWGLGWGRVCSSSHVGMASQQHANEHAA